MKWYSIQDLYTIEKYKIQHSKNPATKWIRLPCVYKIKINSKVVHVGRSDTCRKHGGAEKVRKALVNLLGIWELQPIRDKDQTLGKNQVATQTKF
jgi:hypothetical protein